jgi:hypothetical protein
MLYKIIDATLPPVKPPSATLPIKPATAESAEILQVSAVTLPKLLNF